MKNTLLLLILSVCGFAQAQDYNITFKDKSHIEYNATTWQLAAHTSQYDLYVNKKSIGNKDRVTETTSMVVFHDADGFRYDFFPERVKRIYTYGIIECTNGIFNLLNSWYVDKENKIVYTEIHSNDSYLVDMRASNTSRNDLFQLVCPDY